jgi:hypothetical protein
MPKSRIAREVDEILSSGGGPSEYPHDRARRIVRLAAKQVKNPSTKSWLLADERGTWERNALDYLAKTADKARELGLSDERVDEEIAYKLGYLALQASLENAKKKQKRQ